MKIVHILSLSAAIIGFSTSSAHAVELVTNGDFETGNFTPWTLSGSTTSNLVVTTSPYRGQYVAELGQSQSLGLLSQTLATTPNQTYTLSYFLKSDSTKGPANEFKTTVGSSVVFDQSNIATQAYTKYNLGFQATASSTVLEFGFRNDPGNFYLDDVSVQESSVAVPWKFSPDTSIVIGLPLFIGLRILKKRIALRRSKS